VALAYARMPMRAYFMSERGSLFHPASPAAAGAWAGLDALTALGGIVFDSLIFVQWIGHGFGHLGEERLAVLAATLIIIGVQIIFSSFLVSILGVRQQSSPATP